MARVSHTVNYPGIDEPRLIYSLSAGEATYAYHALYDGLSTGARLDLVQRLYDTNSVEHFVPPNRSFVDVFADMVSHATGNTAIEKPYFVEKGPK